MSETTTPGGEPERKRGFALPSAYTILFALIVVAVNLVADLSYMLVDRRVLRASG